MSADVVSAEAVWAVAAKRLRQRNEGCYRQWGSKIVPVRFGESGELVLGVEDDYFGDWVIFLYPGVVHGLFISSSLKKNADEPPPSKLYASLQPLEII